MVFDARSLFTTNDPNNPTTYTVTVTATGAINGANGVLDLARAAPSKGSWTKDLVVKAIYTNTLGDADETLAIKAQESSVSNFASDVRDVVTLSELNVNEKVACGLGRFTKRYVRLYGTVGGTTPSFTIIAGLVPAWDARCSDDK